MRKISPDSLRKDTEHTMSEFVRMDVSVVVSLLVAVGFIAGVRYHWTGLATAIAMGYVVVSWSVMWEWRATLREEGMVTRIPLMYAKASGLVPIGLALVVLHFNGIPFTISGPITLFMLIAYQFTIYLVAFWGFEPDDLYFKRDPFEGDQRVYKESVYIPRLEERSLEKAKENASDE